MGHRLNLATDITFGERRRLATLIKEFLTPTVIADHRKVQHMHQFFAHHRAYIFGLETFLKSKLQGDPLLAKVVPLPFWDSRDVLPPHFKTFEGGPAVAPNSHTPFDTSTLSAPPVPPTPPHPSAGPAAGANYLDQLFNYRHALSDWKTETKNKILLDPPVTDTNFLNTSYPGKPFPEGSGLDDPASFRDPQDLCTARSNGRGLGMDITEGFLTTAVHYHGITHSSLAGLDTPVDWERVLEYLLSGGPSVSASFTIGPFMNGETTAAPFIFWPLHAFFDTLLYTWEEAWLSPVLSPTARRSSDGAPELFVIGKDGIVWHMCHLGDGGPNFNHGSFGNWEHWHRVEDDPVFPATRLRRIAFADAPGGGTDLVGISTAPGQPTVHARLLPPDCGEASRWVDLGGSNKEISILAAPQARLYVFAIRADNTVHYRLRVTDNDDWTDWNRLLDADQVQIQSILTGSGTRSKAHLFSLANGYIWHRWEVTAGGDWNGPTEYLVPTNHLEQNRKLKFTSFQVAKDAKNRLALFARGRDKKLYRCLSRLRPGRHGTSTHLYDSYSDWTVLDGGPCDDFGLGRNEDGRLEVFIASGGNVFNRWEEQAGSAVWSGRGSIPLDAPMGSLRQLFTTLDKEGRLMVFGVASDGLVWHAWQNAPNQGPWRGWLVT